MAAGRAAPECRFQRRFALPGSRHLPARSTPRKALTPAGPRCSSQSWCAVTKMQHALQNAEPELPTGAHESATQLRLRNKNRVKGLFDMSMDAVDYRSAQDEEPRRDDEARSTSQMTPVRRAALDALEREFSELLKRRPR